MWTFLLGGAIGAALAYFLNNKGGSQTASQTFNRAANTASNVASPLGAAASKAQGFVRENLPVGHDNPNPDDQTLKDRVESVIFADTETGRENININVVDGIVEVRGEQPTQAAIDDLIARIKSVPNVKGVHSYLHLPGTPAPNKVEAIEAS